MAQKQTFRFGSRASLYQVIVQGAEPIYLPGTSTQVGRQKELVAEFGSSDGEFLVTDVNGDPLIDPGTGQQVGRTAHIHGHRFDSRMQQEQKGWTDDEHDRVVARVQFQCRIEPGDVWPLEDARLEAPLPGWSDLSAARKLAISAELGIVADALAFERQEDADGDLIERLEKKLGAEREASAAEEQLVA